MQRLLTVYERMSEQFLISFNAEWNATGHGHWWSHIDGELNDKSVW